MVEFLAFEPSEMVDLVSSIIAVACLLSLMISSISRQESLMEWAWERVARVCQTKPSRLPLLEMELTLAQWDFCASQLLWLRESKQDLLGALD
jgi:hypothetical protein